MDDLVVKDYSELLGEVKSRIRAAQYQALRAVNKELIDLYWNIGKLIVERQQGATWGFSVVEKIASDVRQDFPGIRGYSARNVAYMREFYLAYRDSQKLQPLVAEIGWSHNLTIFEKRKDDLEREFYIRMTKAHDWTKKRSHSPDRKPDIRENAPRPDQFCRHAARRKPGAGDAGNQRRIPV